MSGPCRVAPMVLASDTRPAGLLNERTWMLATAIALHDILDVEGFVNATINQFERGDRPEWARIRGPERDELVLEGLAILYELGRRYEPRRGDHAQDGRFSGFAAFFLPKKLGDAWHRLNENHRYVTQADGTRRWVYLQPAHSLDGLAAPDGDGAPGGDRIDACVLPPTKWTPVRETSRPEAA